MPEYGTATYTATANWSDNSSTTVTPAWSVNPQVAEISPGGVLSCQGGVSSDQTVTITATYSSGGNTETDTMDVTVTNINYRWQPQMLSGQMFYEENIDAEGVYHSYLYIFNANSEFQRYGYENPPDMSDYATGSWDIDASGKLILTIPGQGTISWMLMDLYIWLTTRVVVDDGTGTSYNVDLEWSGPGPQPFNGSLIRGTYVNQYGDTWIFNSNGTGSTTGDGGWTYTWSVDDGILKVVFPNGYVGWMYQRPSENTWTDYPVIEWAFVLNTPTSDFYFYYGGMRLIRQ